MVLEVVFNEGRNEEVTVIVALMHPQFERLSAGFASGALKLRLQLALQEFVCGTLIHQQFAGVLLAGGQ